jgi:predicted SprT family Zn-dependent metalloprotease
MIRRGLTKNTGYLKESANTLSEINKRVTKLIEHVNQKYQGDPGKNYYIKKLKENYNSYILSEAAIDNRYTTYTVDKQDMHICLRTRDQYEKTYDMNVLMYVVIHELAHLCNYSREGYPIQGHGEEFKQIFKLLIIEAIKIDVYRYIDYTKTPSEYCGIMINSTILPENLLTMYLNEAS